MALETTVRARVDGQLKHEVEEILSEIGLSTSQAITLFLKRIKYEKGIPFELKVPNVVTLQAMEEAKSNDGEIVSLDEFLKEKSLPAKAKDHALKGAFKNYREFHISGDLLVIYYVALYTPVVKTPLL